MIEDAQIALGNEVNRIEFTIVKDGDDFTVSVSAPISTGWVDVEIGTYTITVGNTYIIQTDLTYIKLRRLRTGSDGTISGRLEIVHNNILGGADCDVADVSNTRYGCIYLSVDTDTYIEDITSYAIIEGVNTPAGCQIDLLAATIETQRIADAETAPTGLTWTNTETISGLLTAGNYPLWFKTVSSGAVGIVTNVIVINQGSGGDTQDMSLYGRHRRFDDTIDKYRLYGDYAGDTVYGTLIDSAAALPATIALSLPPSGTRDYKLRLVETNKYGIESQNCVLEHNVSVTSTGADATKPQTPSSLSLTFIKTGLGKLSFTYSAQIADPVIYAVAVVNGETLGLDINGFNQYSVHTSEPCTWGDTISASVYFIDSRGRTSATASTSGVCAYDNENRPHDVYGLVGGFSLSQYYPTEYFELIDGLAAIISEPGGVTCYYDGVKQFETVVIDGVMYLDLTGWTVQDESVAGAQAASFKDAGSGVIYFAQGGTRRLKIDTINKTFGANSFKQPITACRLVNNDVTVDGVTYYQAFPNFEMGVRPWLAIDGNDIYTAEIYQLSGS